MAVDYLRNDNGAPVILNGDFVKGESTIQEVDALCRLNQGENKFAPILGPDLVKFVKATVNKDEVESRISLHLKLDGKDYRELKRVINVRK